MISILIIVGNITYITYWTQMPRINIEVKPELHKKAKVDALLRNQTLIQYINEAIEEKVGRDKLKK